MNTTDIGWGGLAASLGLVAIAVVVSAANRLGVERTIVWACARAAAQMLVVGWALTLVFGASASVALAWVWVALMIIVASATVRSRAREVPGAFGLALVALVAVGVVTLGTIFWLGIFPLEARAIVPLAGMQIANAMVACVVVSRRIVAGFAAQRDEIEARLALGLPGREASRPVVRDAMRTAMLPQIESVKVFGIIALPGAMTGLILAGVDPAHAVRIQVAIGYLMIGSVATSVAVVGLGLSRRLITIDHRLVPLARRSE
jgi:putative ABC transport system permease protein